MNVAAPAPDARREKRRPVNYPAWLERSAGGLLPCTIANVSGGGAQLCISKDYALPQRFALWLTENGTFKRGCRVVWRKGDRTGVQFFESGTVVLA